MWLRVPALITIAFSDDFSVNSDSPASHMWCSSAVQTARHGTNDLDLHPVRVRRLCRGFGRFAPRDPTLRSAASPRPGPAASISSCGATRRPRARSSRSTATRPSAYA